MDWLQYLVAIMSGLAVAIPLVIQLVEYVKKSIKEKNWGEIVKLTLDYMKTAEVKFTNGADRKEWVLAMVKSSAVSIEYDLDEAALAKISSMIDSICEAAKTINVFNITNTEGITTGTISVEELESADNQEE